MVSGDIVFQSTSKLYTSKRFSLTHRAAEQKNVDKRNNHEIKKIVHLQKARIYKSWFVL